jgi:cytochrome b pre-mRNA-processing protein 3
MGLIARLLGKKTDEHAAVRPLWHASVALARTPRWYAELGLEDSVPGRFDAVATVLSLVLGRMEQSPALAREAILLTELFVTDMDAQLRETGLGDMVVGKHVGKLMGALGGRKGALDAALAGKEPLEEVLARNLSLAEGADPAGMAAEVRAIAARLAALDDASLLAGKIAA